MYLFVCWLVLLLVTTRTINDFYFAFACRNKYNVQCLKQLKMIKMILQTIRMDFKCDEEDNDDMVWIMLFYLRLMM